MQIVHKNTWKKPANSFQCYAFYHIYMHSFTLPRVWFFSELAGFSLKMIYQLPVYYSWVMKLYLLFSLDWRWWLSRDVTSREVMSCSAVQSYELGGKSHSLQWNLQLNCALDCNLRKFLRPQGLLSGNLGLLRESGMKFHLHTECCPWSPTVEFSAGFQIADYGLLLPSSQIVSNSLHWVWKFKNLPSCLIDPWTFLVSIPDVSLHGSTTILAPCFVSPPILQPVFIMHVRSRSTLKFPMVTHQDGNFVVSEEIHKQESCRL